MAAAPQTGTAIFRGQSGAHYAIDVYVSDVVGALCNWDSGNGASATTETFWTAPESVTLIDFSIITGLTDTTTLRLTANSRNLQSLIRHANYLNTLSFRPVLNTPFGSGERIGLIQA